MKNWKEAENIQFGGGDDSIGIVAKFRYFARLSSGNEISRFHKRSTGKNQRKRKAVTYHLISTQGRSCLVRDYLSGMSEKSLYIRKAVEKHKPSRYILKLCNYLKQILLLKTQIRKVTSYLIFIMSHLIVSICGQPSISFNCTYTNFIIQFFSNKLSYASNSFQISTLN